MKEIGIIRKVDELGRIVLPKELRKNLEIQQGTSIEIFVHEDSIMLKKYNPVLCKKCGQHIEKEDKFCKYCGEKIKR